MTRLSPAAPPGCEAIMSCIGGTTNAIDRRSVIRFPSGDFTVRSEKYIALGGFNKLFFPAYGEDLHLGFRAWSEGWHCVFGPASLAFHREHGPWGGADNSRVSMLCERAAWLYQWSCLPSTAPRLERTDLLWLTATRKVLRGQSGWLRVRLDTWPEWCGQQSSHRVWKVSSAELNSILARLAAPAVLPGECI